MFSFMHVVYLTLFFVNMFCIAMFMPLGTMTFSLLLIKLQNFIYQVSIEFTCNTHFVMHWSMYYFSYFQVNIHIQYKILALNM